MACVSCHRKDDKHKGRFGDKCQTCHNAKAWDDVLFDHDRDTKYALRGKHRQAKCDSCHTGNLYRDKLSNRLRCLSQEGRQAQEHAGREMRRLPRRAQLERSALRSWQVAFSLARKARRHRVQGLSQERGLQGNAHDLHRLPQERRQAQRLPGRAVRRLSWRTQLEGAPVRSRQDEIRATRASTAK